MLLSDRKINSDLCCSPFLLLILQIALDLRMISKSVSPRQITIPFKRKVERSFSGNVASCTPIGATQKIRTTLLSLSWRRTLIASRFDWNKNPSPQPEPRSPWLVLAIHIHRKLSTKSAIPSWKRPWTTLIRRNVWIGWKRATSIRTCCAPLTKERTAAAVIRVARFFWKEIRFRMTLWSVLCHGM